MKTLKLGRKTDKLNITDEAILQAAGIAGGSADVVYVIRPLEKNEAKVLRAKYVTKTWVEHQEVEKFDADGFGTGLIDYVLLDWKNVTDMDDNALQCTTENKLLLEQNVINSIVGYAIKNHRGEPVVASEFPQSA
jgi:uncharacterized alkaline shock family protein YloU